MGRARPRAAARNLPQKRLAREGEEDGEEAAAGASSGAGADGAGPSSTRAGAAGERWRTRGPQPYSADMLHYIKETKRRSSWRRSACQ